LERSGTTFTNEQSQILQRVEQHLNKLVQPDILGG
jgi:hypothetical protein